MGWSVVGSVALADLSGQAWFDILIVVIIAVAGPLLVMRARRQPRRSFREILLTECQHMAAFRGHDLSPEHLSALVRRIEAASAQGSAEHWLRGDLLELMALKILHDIFYVAGLDAFKVAKDDTLAVESLTKARQYITWPGATYGLAFAMIRLGRHRDAMEALDDCLKEFAERREKLRARFSLGVRELVDEVVDNLDDGLCKLASVATPGEFPDKVVETMDFCRARLVQNGDEARWTDACARLASGRGQSLSPEHLSVLDREGQRAFVTLLESATILEDDLHALEQGDAVMSLTAAESEGCEGGVAQEDTTDLLATWSLHHAFFMVGLRRSSRGDLAGSESSLRTSHEYIEWPTTHFALAMTLLSAGKNEGALVEFRDCIDDIDERLVIFRAEWPGMGDLCERIGQLLDGELSILGFRSYESLAAAARTAIENHAKYGFPTPSKLA